MEAAIQEVYGKTPKEKRSIKDKKLRAEINKVKELNKEMS